MHLVNSHNASAAAAADATVHVACTMNNILCTVSDLEGRVVWGLTYRMTRLLLQELERHARGRTSAPAPR